MESPGLFKPFTSKTNRPPAGKVPESTSKSSSTGSSCGLVNSVNFQPSKSIGSSVVFNNSTHSVSEAEENSLIITSPASADQATFAAEKTLKAKTTTPKP